MARSVSPYFSDRLSDRIFPRTPLQEMLHPFTLIIGTNANPDPLVAIFSQRLQIPQNRHIGQPNDGLGHILNANTISQIGPSQQMLDEERSLQIRQRQPEP